MIFISKDTFNGLSYKIEKDYIIKSLYESWEAKQIQDFIDKNNLVNYITNHDEILVHIKDKVTYVPSIFGIETIEERKEIAKEYNAKSKEDFIKERNKRIKERDRKDTLIHYRGVLKRTKKFIRRQYYIYKIESLKVSYDENILLNSLVF